MLINYETLCKFVLQRLIIKILFTCSIDGDSVDIQVHSLKAQRYTPQTERLLSSVQTLQPLLCSATDSVVRPVNY